MTISDRISVRHISRRGVIAGAVGTIGSVAVGTRSVHADEEATAQFTDALQSYLNGRAVSGDGGVVLTMPELAENGNMVPFSVSVASPMTQDDYVASITLFSTGNPQPVIARFYFSPVSGRALASGRLRLARSQDVVAAAELSNGVLLMGRANVQVTIGGCGAG